MLRVAVEPSNHADLGALVKGPNLLNQVDPLVDTRSRRGVSMSLLQLASFIWIVASRFAGDVCQGPAGGLKAIGFIQDHPRRMC